MTTEEREMRDLMREEAFRILTENKRGMKGERLAEQLGLSRNDLYTLFADDARFVRGATGTSWRLATQTVAPKKKQPKAGKPIRVQRVRAATVLNGTLTDTVATLRKRLADIDDERRRVVAAISALEGLGMADALIK